MYENVFMYLQCSQQKLKKNGFMLNFIFRSSKKLPSDFPRAEHDFNDIAETIMTAFLQDNNCNGRKKTVGIPNKVV